jgi:hypothetical protein
MDAAIPLQNAATGYGYPKRHETIVSRYQINDQKISEVAAVTARSPRSGSTCHSRQSTSVGIRSVAFAYLRAAQAYMLISMPTGTSTIFGVFQAISDLLSSGTADCRPVQR